jgi:hypothetical protein
MLRMQVNVLVSFEMNELSNLGLDITNIITSNLINVGRTTQLRIRKII